ncbi:MAG: hypothetical protein VX444_01525 [Pseudomonadota bacterium]|nr:hypothetical protein [Pseudomonadota bacterium]
MDGDLTSISDLEGLSMEFDASAKPILKVDVERYQSYLDDSDWTDAQKEEFLQNFWQVIVGLVEFGFGVHPVQEVCGKDARTNTQNAAGAFDAVCSDKPESEEDSPGLSP